MRARRSYNAQVSELVSIEVAARNEMRPLDLEDDIQ
jgi:hypothetical protein